MNRLKETIERIGPLDQTLSDAIQRRLDNKTKPLGSLGRLEEFARRYCTIRGGEEPTLVKKVIYTFAGDHGVVEEGVSAFPKEVTRQMVLNFIGGGAGVNVLARHVGAEVRVVDIGVDYYFGLVPNLITRKIRRGTANFTRGPAMTRDEAIEAILAGISLAEKAADEGVDILGTGEMGIGNTTPSSAIIAIFSGLSPREVTSRGTGIDDAALSRKIDAITRGIEVNRPDPADPVDVLAKVGGLEIAGIAGLCLGAAARRIPVVVDGFISTAGALIAAELCPTVTEYFFAAHRSVEIGHQVMLDRMGLSPILDLSLRLGEGTGAALAMGLIEAGVKILNEMATFQQAGVSEGR
ncbi:MAG: nicotinate-nucleotide--dimethylbenzimidazole phosphoribosyltransferase [Desulfuromonadia bacterium]